MEQKDIIEGNKLIAEFMGSKRDPQGDISEDYEHYNGVGMLGGYAINFSYHLSWDWLMPVVEKIESLELDRNNYEVWIHTWSVDIVSLRKGHSVRKQKIQVDIEEGDSKILATYRAVIDFIKFYNTNNPHL
jgi:hypothetical protein